MITFSPKARALAKKNGLALVRIQVIGRYCKNGTMEYSCPVEWLTAARLFDAVMRAHQASTRKRKR